jgi:hypothetical protein
MNGFDETRRGERARRGRGTYAWGGRGPGGARPDGTESDADGLDEEAARYGEFPVRNLNGRVAAADEERTTRWSGGRDTGRRPDTAEYGTEAFQDHDRAAEQAGDDEETAYGGYEGTLRARGPVERGGPARGSAVHGRAADEASGTRERASGHPVSSESGASQDADAADAAATADSDDTADDWDN